MATKKSLELDEIGPTRWLKDHLVKEQYVAKFHLMVCKKYSAFLNRSDL